MARFAPSGWTNVAADSVSGRGTFVGTYDSGGDTLGYIRSSGGRFSSFAVPGAISTRPNANVESRLIAGSEIDANQQQHGFLLAK
jgi:hypothetical protein